MFSHTKTATVCRYTQYLDSVQTCTLAARGCKVFSQCPLVVYQQNKYSDVFAYCTYR